MQPRCKLAQELPEVLTVAELAKRMRTGSKPFYNAIQRGEIAHFLIGRCIRIPRHEALRILREGIVPRGGGESGSR